LRGCAGGAASFLRVFDFLNRFNYARAGRLLVSHLSYSRRGSSAQTLYKYFQSVVYGKVARRARRVPRKKSRAWAKAKLDPGVKVRRRISFESANLIGSPQDDGERYKVRPPTGKGTGPGVKTRASGKHFEMNRN
jgi:hypothetical protein